MDWLADNWQNILVLGIVAGAVFFVVFSIVRQRKKEKTLCCGCCGRCGKQCNQKENP